MLIHRGGAACNGPSVLTHSLCTLTPWWAQVYTCLGPSGWARASAAEAEVRRPGGSGPSALGVALELAREYSLEPWRLPAAVYDFEEHLEDLSRSGPANPTTNLNPNPKPKGLNPKL